MGRLRSLEKMTPKKAIFSTVLSKIVANGKTTTAQRTSFDWHCFSTSHTVRESYTVEVKNRFEALYQLEEKHTVNDLYTAMIKAQMDAAEKCIPKKKRVKKRVPWEKELVKEKRNELKKAYLKNKRLPNSDNANYLKQAKEELQAAYESEQVEYLAQKCAAVQHQAKKT